MLFFFCFVLFDTGYNHRIFIVISVESAIVWIANYFQNYLAIDFILILLILISIIPIFIQIIIMSANAHNNHQSQTVVYYNCIEHLGIEKHSSNVNTNIALRNTIERLCNKKIQVRVSGIAGFMVFICVVMIINMENEITMFVYIETEIVFVLIRKIMFKYTAQYKLMYKILQRVLVFPHMTKQQATALMSLFFSKFTAS